MELFGFEISMTIVWVALAILLIVVEALTMGLTTVWFAGGALAALVVSLLGGGIPLQVGVFALVSLVLLAFTRKIFVGKMNVGSTKNNVEAIIGTKGIVRSMVKPYEMGEVFVDGKIWSCICKDNSQTIEEGTEIRVVAIEGVKLIVEVA